MTVLTTYDDVRCRDLREEGTFFWVDLHDPADDELRALEPELGLHPLALEDTLEFGQPPKLDAYGDHALLVFYSARECAPGPERLFEPVEVHLYVAADFVVTVRRTAFEPFERLHASFDEDHGVYRLLDTLTDALIDVSERIETRVDALEAAVLERAQREQVRHIYRLKQEVRDLQRRVGAQRDRFERHAETILALPGIDPDERRYLGDVRDNLERANGELTRQVEDLQALTGTYFNANAHRLNVVATQLSVVAFFFVIWQLVTGFFGQNFEWLVGTMESRNDFLVFGVGGLVVPTLLAAALLWIKRRDLF